MTSFDAVLSSMGVISFLLFLIFYKRLKPSSFWDKGHPRPFWTMLHFALSGSRTATLIIAMYQGRHVEIFSALITVVVFAATGTIMMRLASRAETMSLNDRLSDDIDKDVKRISSK